MAADKGCGIRPNMNSRFIIEEEDPILVTGANGFIGSRVIRTLLEYGFKRIRCLTRATSNPERLDSIVDEFGGRNVEILKGNLLSCGDCVLAADGAALVYHLAAGIEKSFPGCFLNSAVTTRNLLEAVTQATLKRFVSISSLAVYSNQKICRGGRLDELCEVEPNVAERYEPYVYGKVKQDEIVVSYGRTKGIPYVLVRPGVVFGPGKAQITGRVGIDTFGVFLHLGLGNRIPLTYVDNCAEAIVLAGLKPGIEGEVINVVDDDLPKSRQFIRKYKKRVGRFFSIPVPYPVFLIFCSLWERYSKWSEGQLPPVFNKQRCDTYWKGNTYSNEKAKTLLGWSPRVPMAEGLENYFDYARRVKVHT